MQFTTEPTVKSHFTAFTWCANTKSTSIHRLTSTEVNYWKESSKKLGKIWESI